MAQLKRDARPVLQASTLIEVLVAMTILLTVFAAGMMLFASLTRTSVSRNAKDASLRMHDMAVRYIEGQDPLLSEDDGLSFFVEEESFAELDDLRKIKVYAQRAVDGLLLDSVIMIRKRHEKR